MWIFFVLGGKENITHMYNRLCREVSVMLEYPDTQGAGRKTHRLFPFP